MKRVILTTIILSIFFVAFDLFAAEKILDYGFEDWTGNADTTPGYIFGSSYSSYYTTHKSATEVVSSCGSWTPHSGNYFFYRQHYSGFSDPCLNGGTGTINDHGNIGGSYAYGHNSSFRCSQLGSEIFIKFWFILNAGYSDFGSVASKFVRIYTDAEAVYAHLGGGGQIHLYNRYPSASWGPSISWPGGSPIGDGQWHSFALYANLDGNGTGN